MEPARLCRHVNHVAKLGTSYRLKLPYNVDPDCDRKTVGLCNNSALVQSLKPVYKSTTLTKNWEPSWSRERLGTRLISC